MSIHVILIFMIKIIAPIILFIILIFGISSYWNKANVKNKKRFAALLVSILVFMFIATTYFVIN